MGMKLACLALALSIGTASAQTPTPGNSVILQPLGPDQFQLRQHQPFQLNQPLPIGILVPAERPLPVELPATPPKMQEDKGPSEKRDRMARQPPSISAIKIWRDEIGPELKRRRMAD
jgi:hypothetical protein